MPLKKKKKGRNYTGSSQVCVDSVTGIPLISLVLKSYFSEGGSLLYSPHETTW